jgi:hypothetical protein
MNKKHYINLVRSALDSKKIVHTMVEKDESSIIQANLKETEGEEDPTEVYLIIDGKTKTFSIYARELIFYPATISRHIRRIVNNINRIMVFGNCHIGRVKGTISYRHGHSLEGDNSLQDSQLFDYINAMIYYKKTLNDKINEEIQEQNKNEDT